MSFYVTSSLPYVNGEPHLGHAMEFIMADVLARYSRLSGQSTYFSIGTDEHGGKISEKAIEAGLEPKAFADKVSAQFAELAKLLNVSNDAFIRTTDPDHEQRSKKVWENITDDIYKKNYVGWYCIGDEAFFTEAVVKANNGICPNHNRPYEKVEEENYFFKLSKYGPKILAAIESNELRIIPETKRNEILYVIKEGLEDISVSRPVSKIAWGISVPGDDKQVMYVWFEALLNYITVLGYPDGEKFKEFWPADYQIIGKDILRFHAAIWPAILLALDLPMQKNLYVHGFVNVENQKMSKSLGNFIAPSKIVDKFGSDGFRYFFLRHIPSYADGDFSWEKLHNSYQNELGNELGNAVQRTAVMVANYLNGEVDSTKSEFDEKVKKYVLDCKFDRALDTIWEQVKELNQYVDDNKPWMLQKEGKMEELKKVLNHQVKSLRSIALNLEPFMPNISDQITKIFGAKVTIPETTLFPRVELADLESK